MVVSYIRVACTAFAIALLALSASAQDLDALFSDPLANRDEVIRVSDEVIRVSDEAESLYKKRVVLEPILFKALNNSKLSGDNKRFVAEQIYKFADEDSVPELSKLLYRSGTGDIACRGLEQIDHPDALDALLAALRKASGSTLASVIESLGRRRAHDAVGALRQFVQSGNTEVVRASLNALGEIGGEEAAQILGLARLSVKRSLREEGTRAYLRCGWTSLSDGDRQAALDVFDSLMIEVEPLEIRQEAIRGIVQTERERSIPIVIEALQGNEPGLQTAAAEAISEIEGESVTLALVSVFPDLLPEIQRGVVGILGERRDLAGLPTVIQSTINRDSEVRLEALRAIGKFNHPETLHTLLKISATGSPEEQELAQAALRDLEGPEINPELVKQGMSADNAVRLEAVKMMPLRNATEGVGVLARIAERDVPEIQFEGLKALAKLGTPAELELMISAWMSDWSPEQRAIIGEGIVSIAKRAAPGEQRVKPLHEALRRAGSTEAKNGIIDALSQIQEDASISVLMDEIRKADPTVQARIIQLFGNWPTDAPAAELEKIARSADSQQTKSQAYDALLKVLMQHADPGSDSTVKLYRRVLKLADTPEKRDQLRPGLERLTHVDAPELIEALDSPRRR